MINYKNLPIGENAPVIVNAVIEIPSGSSNKYEYDVDLQVFRLDRVLYSPVHYPMDYGFIPSTLADDGDPLDILILISRPTFPGCVLEARPVGMLGMVDDNGVDEKILAVAQGDPRYQRIDDLKSIEPHILQEIEHFFNVYKSLEGRMSLTFGWSGKADALQRIATVQTRRP
jgi:inorganic pyrophosphatase